MSALATCEDLHQRLEEGDRRIAEAQRAGHDVAEWEVFWIRLLREYERAWRELPGQLREAVSDGV
jgi:hypothetical protein